MADTQEIVLRRAVQVIGIPNGIAETLKEASRIRLVQSLGGSYTVTDERGYMFRVDESDADALGFSAPQPASAAPAEFDEQAVWTQLKTVYDPEIPVNIVDLGLIYSCEIESLAPEGKRIEVRMSMTAPGCGMGNVLKADVESKLRRLPGVKEVQVELVFDPPWGPARMSEAAKLQLGFDLDYGAGSTFPTI